MRFFREFKSGFHAFGQSVNTVASFIVMIFVYFIGVGVTSVIGKIFHKNFLPIKILPTRQTFWFDTNISPDIEECRRGF